MGKTRIDDAVRDSSALARRSGGRPVPQQNLCQRAARGPVEQAWGEAPSGGSRIITISVNTGWPALRTSTATRAHRPIPSGSSTRASAVVGSRPCSARLLWGPSCPGHTSTCGVTVTAGAMSLGLETWVAPTGCHLACLGFAGLSLTFGQAGILLAYRLGRASTVAPFFSSFVLWGVVPGLIVQSRLPSRGIGSLLWCAAIFDGETDPLRRKSLWRALPNAPALAGVALISRSGIAIVVLDRRRAHEELALTDAL
jgi:hypothetical protein